MIKALQSYLLSCDFALRGLLPVFLTVYLDACRLHTCLLWLHVVVSLWFFAVWFPVVGFLRFLAVGLLWFTTVGSCLPACLDSCLHACLDVCLPPCLDVCLDV